MNWFRELSNKLFFYKRSIIFFWQRMTRGWDDSETWSMDSSFAKIILPRLKRFQEIRSGHPAIMSEEEWDNIIKEIIWGFEWFAAGNQYGFGPEHSINRDRANAGIELFAKHYSNLWW